MTNVASWFEIPVVDMDRAQKFYSAVLKTTFDASGPDMPGTSFFHMDEMGVGGHLQYGQGVPSLTGPLIYLAAPDGVTETLSRVEAAGGKVVVSATPIGAHGWIGTFHDSEGNGLALHSMTK